ncbi:MAG: hypothetical protein II973_12885 [Spirochaetaceae bacterium]|nr:hypothetical protein [Spirochaetaceae bacterium]
MKVRYLLLGGFVLISVVFFSVMFTSSEAIFTRIAKSETEAVFNELDASKLNEDMQQNIVSVEEQHRWEQINNKFNMIWGVYVLFSVGCLGCLSDASKSVAFRLLVILVSCCIVAAVKMYSAFIKIDHFKLDLAVLYFPCFILSLLIIYELIHWIVFKVSGFDFVMVGRWEFFKQPENALLSIVTMILSILLTFLLIKLMVGNSW